MNRIAPALPALLLIAAMTGTASAQNTIFLSQGKIEYERRINQYAQMEERRDPGDNSGWAEISKKFVGDKFKTDYFNLLFTREKTLYKPGKESPGRPNPFFNDPPAQAKAAPGPGAPELAPGAAKPDEQFLFLKVEYQLVRIALDDILYIEGLKDYIKVHRKTSDKALM